MDDTLPALACQALPPRTPLKDWFSQGKGWRNNIMLPVFQSFHFQYALLFLYSDTLIASSIENWDDREM